MLIFQVMTKLILGRVTRTNISNSLKKQITIPKSCRSRPKRQSKRQFLVHKFSLYLKSVKTLTIFMLFDFSMNRSLTIFHIVPIFLELCGEGGELDSFAHFLLFFKGEKIVRNLFRFGERLANCKIGEGMQKYFEVLL